MGYVCMESSISTAEFQRFQTQLLDLREANIQANECRHRAEMRVKQLEDELAKSLKLTETRHADRNQLENVIKENKQLRDKLLSTESSFQLQSSTLQAECHHLSNEVCRLQELLAKPKTTSSCQTTVYSTLEAAVQCEDDTADKFQLESSSAQEIQELQMALDIATTTQRVYTLTNETLANKLYELEHSVHGELIPLRSQVEQLTRERTALLDRLCRLQRSIATAQTVEQDLRGQLDVVRARGEKVNRELRRQLARFVRNPPNETDRISLHKSSFCSSTSSLSSAFAAVPTGPDVASHRRTPSSSIPNGWKPENGQQEFFSSDDFKALITRLSEVQDENCTFRRQQQRLQAELIRLSDENMRLGGHSQHHLQPPGNPSCNSANRSTSSSFSLLNLLKPTGTSATVCLPNTNLETVNRLRHMCEDLLTENIQLTDELERLRAVK